MNSTGFARGAYFWVMGSPRRSFRFPRDVTAARKADERLHQLNESLEEKVASRTGEHNHLRELSLDLMLRCRFDGEILTVNPAWFEMLGWRESELVGTSLFDLVHPDDLKRTEGRAEAHAEGVSF